MVNVPMKKKGKHDASADSQQRFSLKEKIERVRTALGEKEEHSTRSFPEDVTFLSAGIEIFCGVVVSFMCCWGAGEVFNASPVLRCISGLLLSFVVTGWSIYKKVRKMS